MKRAFTLLAVLALAGATQAEPIAEPAAFDIDPPEIADIKTPQSREPLQETTINATVTDDVGLQSVALYYRPIGGAEFRNVEMTRGGDDVYFATLPAEAVTAPGVEYFIEAKDTAGNTVLRGYEALPLLISVAPPAGLEAENTGNLGVTQSAPSKKNAKLSYWKWIVGAVIVAGIAAAAQGGDDGGGAANQDTGTSPDAGNVNTLIVGAPYPSPAN